MVKNNKHDSILATQNLSIEIFVKNFFLVVFKGECSVFKKNYIKDENDSSSEYNKIPLGHNRTNGAVYSKIYFKVEICSAL